jgi:AraC-like DNA-binding protein
MLTRPIAGSCSTMPSVGASYNCRPFRTIEESIGCEAARNGCKARWLSGGYPSRFMKENGASDMPDSEVLTFADPDAFHANIRRSQVEGVVTARGEYRAELTCVDLPRVYIHRGDESLPRVLNVTPRVNRASILFATDQRQAAMHFGGVELPPDEIIRFGSPGHFRSSAACRWGVMSLTYKDFADAGQAIIGRDLTSPFFAQRIKPPPALFGRLSNLHEAATHLAKTAPDILAQSEVARALEQALVHAMVLCMGGGEAAETGSAHHRHAAVARRLEELLEANSDRTLYLTELCSAAGVSERTLRACCQEHLGMNPTRYLWLRRMHLARRGLRIADPAATTVTEIATNYGFWELGRFSVAYRSLFGESPSASLRRVPEDPRPQKITASPWELPVSA